MCGIFGVVGRRDTDGLREAALTLKHRGPDAFGEWNDPTAGVYLAHCRLSIIDLSDAGRQPMSNEDGTVQVTFNGEVYNFGELRAELERAGHQFRSRTDTEVIVHAYEEWGLACVERFRGIFAFGIWDGNRRRLLLARDRLGVKPLYYTICGEQLAFASEPRALLAIPGFTRSLFIPAAIQFLQYTYTTGSTTIWDEVYRLPPAHVIEYDASHATVIRRQYWNVPEVDHRWKLIDATDCANQLMSDAVREELTSDVPVGVFLSGGVDSSLISAYAARANPSISSFCVDFVGWDGSEAIDAQSVANYLGTSHHTCYASRERSGLGDSEWLSDFFHTWDEPVGDPAIIPTWLISKLTREHVTVALSGDGGDELFAGYGWYRGVQPNARRRLSWLFERLLRFVGVGRPWPSGCANEFEYYQLLHCPTFSIDELRRLFPDWTADLDQSPAGALYKQWYDSKSESARRWQTVDLHTYLVDNNLARVDRASMAHGLEVRVPLLDHRLVEFACSLPDVCCYQDGRSKRVLRELMQRLLPESVWNKPKQGFSFPLDRFVSHREMWTTINSGNLARYGILNRVELNRWQQEPQAGNLQIKLWLLFVLEHWSSRWLFQDRPSEPESRIAVPSLVGAGQ